MNVNLPLGQKLKVVINHPRVTPKIEVTSGDANIISDDTGITIEPLAEGIVIVEITWADTGENIIITVEKEIIPSFEINSLQLSLLP